MEPQQEPNPPGENVPPRLAEFLSGRRDHLIRRWIEAIRRNDTLGTPKEVSDEELADHLPRLFDDLVATLRGEPVADAAKADAQAHGDHRWQQHYDLEEVLEELGIVCRILLSHGLDAFADAHPDTPKEQLRGARARILRFFENTSTDSVRRYVERTGGQMRTRGLSLSEQRRLALDSARMGWWHLDLASRQVFCDERFKTIHGTREEVVSYDWILSIIHPDDREGINTAVQAAIRPVEPALYSVDCRLVLEDGSTRWVTGKGQAIFEGEGADRRAVSLVGTVTDVTEATAIQEALSLSEAKYRSLFDSIDAGFCVFDLIWDGQGEPVDYRFLEVNAAFEQQSGMKNVVGRTIRELYPDIEPRWIAIHGRVSRTGEPIRLTEGSDAIGRWYDLYAFPIGPRAPWQVAVLFTDITARRRSEEMFLAAGAVLQKSEARFRQLADAMPQIVWTARPDGVLDYTNHRWYEYIQRREEDWNVEDWHLRVHPDDIAGAAAVWAGCVASGEPYATEFRVRRGDGEYRWFLVRALSIRGPDGSIVHWYGTCTDIRDQRALLEQNARLLDSERAARTEAERIGRMKDEFLATLSHELRTPLNAILGWTQVLRGEPANTEDVEQGLATIERNSRAQNAIIEDLLDMSRIVSGKVRLDVQPLDLDQVVKAAVESMRPAADAKDIRLQTLIDPEARMISGDPNRLQQVFWNLLSNAIKFTPKEGRVQVVLERINSHLEVSVIDSGEGIAPDFLPYVFDRFRQQDASTTRRHGGLGLGLAIVKQLVELHGGSISVESLGVGRGTTFRVVLPLWVVRSEAEAADDVREHPHATRDVSLPIPTDRVDLTGINVLVVDDEADARALIKRLLEDRGATVSTAGSAAQALERIGARIPDVLVSDIGMPSEDGYALMRLVRALAADRGGKVPAVALTAYARSEDRLRVILEGFQAHLAKPVEAAELVALVASLAGGVSHP